jgi:2,4-dienoyl-CoA reductase-like NADH-dependent reductase (Old Yellow Enzyme family)
MSLLFSPTRINSTDLRNRVVMLPMGTRFDLTTQKARAYYAARAKGGAGLIIVEGTDVGLFDDPSFALKLVPLVDAMHEHGARAIIQLAKSPRAIDGATIAPSATEGAREASVEDIRWAVGQYAEAARQSCQAGFDGVEIHGAHGFFTSQFFSPRSNRRTDEYGGDTNRRMRFGLECAAAARAAIGREAMLAYRLSGMEYVENGVTLEDSCAMASSLESVGVDLIDVSAGAGPKSTIPTSPTAHHPMGTFAPLAQAIKGGVSVPVIAIGRLNTVAAAEECLSRGQGDLAGVGRQLIADPMWPAKLESGREDSVVECLSCNQCLGRLMKGLPIDCAVNAEVGLEWQR